MNAIGGGYRVGHMPYGEREAAKGRPVCPTCGEVFERRGPEDTRTYCCRSCHPRPSRWTAPDPVAPDPPAGCRYCGGPVPPPHTHGARVRKYCCDNHRRMAWRKRNATNT